jgi:hypothetical protein
MTDHPEYAFTCTCGYHMFHLTDQGIQCVYCCEVIRFADIEDVICTEDERAIELMVH